MGRYRGSRSCVTGGQFSNTTTPALLKLPPPPALFGLPPASPPPRPEWSLYARLRMVLRQHNPQAACIGHGLDDILLQIEEVV